MKWSNLCAHDPETYIGWVKSSDGKVYDIYVYPAHGAQEICARYGNEPHTYLGIGSLENLFLGSTLATNYKDICCLLLEHGFLKYCRNA
jgi:hypothetical protein